MQHHLYLSDTYLGERATTALASGRGEDGRPWVALSENIFHPQGGGQPNDVGTVDGAPVRVRRDGGLVVLDADDGSSAGFPAEGELVAQIDLEVRKLHAALHTAGHLLDGYLGRLGFQHTGNSHFPGQARVDYKLGDQPVDREALTEQVNEYFAQAVRAALKVTAEVRDGVRRVTIEDLNTEPCGGTHVSDLSALRDVSVRAIKVKAGLMKVGYSAAHI